MYIFVVEEDKSFFEFEDRIKLVKEGTKDLENVTVIPSGKLIISSLIFPEYFDKEKDNDVEVDTSVDVDLFGKYIAPKYGINIRFAGEKPFDRVTRQYNIAMEDKLPRHGVKFVEIQSKKSVIMLLVQQRLGSV